MITSCSRIVSEKPFYFLYRIRDMSGIKSILKETWSEESGKRLKLELREVAAGIVAVDSRVQAELIKRTGELAAEVKSTKLWNMTNDGQISFGKKLQGQSKKIFDEDVSGGYAYWLVGAWLESGNRLGGDALYVRRALDNLLSDQSEDVTPDIFIAILHVVLSDHEKEIKAERVKQASNKLEPVGLTQAEERARDELVASRHREHEELSSRKQDSGGSPFRVIVNAIIVVLILVGIVALIGKNE